MSLGHNSVAGDALRGYVERVERIEEEKRGLAKNAKAVIAEAKANGFDPKILRAVVKARRRSQEEREGEQALFDTYMHALGMAALED